VTTSSEDETASGFATAASAAVADGELEPEAVAAGAATATATATTTKQQTVVKDEWSKTPRNAPCPCGSGKKFKLCHGANN